MVVEGSAFGIGECRKSQVMVSKERVDRHPMYSESQSKVRPILAINRQVSMTIIAGHQDWSSLSDYGWLRD